MPLLLYGVAPMTEDRCCALLLNGSSIDDLNFNYMLKRSINDVNSESDLSIESGEEEEEDEEGERQQDDKLYYDNDELFRDVTY